MPVLACLAPCLDSTTLRRLTHVVAAMLSMTGRITMLGLSRWTGKGGSYCTVQRFFNTAIPWEKAQWFMIRRHLQTVPGAVLLTGDEVVTPRPTATPMDWGGSSRPSMASRSPAYAIFACRWFRCASGCPTP